MSGKLSTPQVSNSYFNPATQQQVEDFHRRLASRAEYDQKLTLLLAAYQIYRMKQNMGSYPRGSQTIIDHIPDQSHRSDSTLKLKDKRMMVVSEVLSDLAEPLLMLSAMFLWAIVLAAFAMGVLWFMGYTFPFVVAQLGLPYHTVYELLEAIFRDIFEWIKAAQVSG